MGAWVPVHDDQWDGDVPIQCDQQDLEDHGEVVFQKDQLPWQVGKYEVSQLARLKDWYERESKIGQVPPRWKVQCDEHRRTV